MNTNNKLAAVRAILDHDWSTDDPNAQEMTLTTFLTKYAALAPDEANEYALLTIKCYAPQGDTK